MSSKLQYAMTSLLHSSTCRLVGWLLFRANAHPPLARDAFYALKDRLLQRYGTYSGEDIQQIIDPCWGSHEDGCSGSTCTRCGGTGIWRERRIRLSRWSLAGRVFHRPDGPASPRQPATITGRIVHAGVTRAAAFEALLWLSLLYDRSLLWRVLCSHTLVFRTWYPLSLLHRLVQWCRHLERYLPRNCTLCNRWYGVSLHSRWWICSTCSANDDIPF
jgi:hypothetical protein